MFETMATQERDIRHESWDVSQPLCEKIYSEGFQAYLDSLDKSQVIESCFKGENTVCCIDERVGGCLHSAGSLLLLPVEKAREAVEKGGVEALTSHAGCGAAAIKYRQVHNLDDLAEINGQELDAFAQEQTKALATELGIEYKGHISFDDMRGNPQLHDARAVVVHTTPYFDQNKIKGMIPSFAVSATLLGDAAVEDIQLAEMIATGAHGEGDLFTAENPFIMIGLGEHPEDLEYLRELLTKATGSLGDHVRVELASVTR